MRREEQQRQKQIAMFLDVALGSNVMWFHIPNGGRRSPIEAAIFRGMGVKAGLPDIVVVENGRALFVELKSPGGKLSEAQGRCHEALRRAGCPVTVARSLDEVIAFLTGERVPLKISSLGRSNQCRFPTDSVERNSARS